MFKIFSWILRMSDVCSILICMKKNKAPLSKTNNAIRKAYSKELFTSLMLSPHLVVTPAFRKGSRMTNKRRAINESL